LRDISEIQLIRYRFIMSSNIICCFH